MISDLDFEKRLKSAREDVELSLGFNHYVRAKMKSQNLNAVALAEKTRLSEATIQRALSPSNNPSDLRLEIVIRVALVLRVDSIMLDNFIRMAGKCFSSVSLGYHLFYLNAYDMDLSDALDWMEHLEAKRLLPKC